ncbi:hypothetical protein Tsubulata_048840, partial [Turnera subulata]
EPQFLANYSLSLSLNTLSIHLRYPPSSSATNHHSFPNHPSSYPPPPPFLTSSSLCLAFAPATPSLASFCCCLPSRHPKSFQVLDKDSSSLHSKIVQGFN